MELNLRKIVIGLLVLSVVILAYAVYVQFTDDPPIPDGEDFVTAPAEEDTPNGIEELDDTEETGKATVKQTRFVHKDQGRIDREFGFEVLKNPEEDQWTLTNPFMKLFMGDFDCFITADKGQAQIDMSLRDAMPDDIMFSGNVVVRIISLDPNHPEEVFVYLDDVAFVGEESRFSTSGSVKFLSRVAKLEGQGLELIYDELLGQLKLFRIKDLDSLRIRSDQFEALSDQMGPKPVAQETAEPNVIEPERQVSIETEPPSTPVETPTAPEDDYYHCVFYRNVTIRTPKEIVTAKEQFTISNILFTEPKSKTETETKTSDTTDKPAVEAIVNDTKPIEPVSEPNKPRHASTANPNALDTTASKSLDLDAIPESFFDIVVTCDGGFVIAPTDELNAFSEKHTDAGSPTANLELEESLQEAMSDPNRSVVVAQSVDVNVETTDTTLTGPVTMTVGLDPNDLTGKNPDADLMPVRISVQKAVRYLSTGNEVLLEGPCTVTLEEADPNFTREYTLSAPTLRLALMEDPNANPKGPGITLRQFTASGGPIAIRARQKAGEELISWAELLATEMDYRADEKTFAILGPGQIRVHNGQTLDVEADPNNMLNQPCFAFMRNFDSLLYSADANEIVAAVNTGVIQIDYFPLIDGTYGQQSIHADVGHIDIKLTQAADAQKELASITASNGIAIKDELTYECFGSTLFYDHKIALVTVMGDESQPCYFNGALVDEVEIDTVTGDVKTHIRGPSTLQAGPQ